MFCWTRTLSPLRPVVMTQTDKAVPHGHFLDTPELPKGVTRFWLIRHAVVEASARKTMYGALDVPLCREAMASQQGGYATLARRLPTDALWYSSPLQRAQDTAAEIRKAGAFSQDVTIDGRFIEQSIGKWHGTPHSEFMSLLRLPPNPFWSISACELPPGGRACWMSARAWGMGLRIWRMHMKVRTWLSSAMAAPSGRLWRMR